MGTKKELRQAWYSEKSRKHCDPIVYKREDGTEVAVTCVEKMDGASSYAWSDKVDCGIVVAFGCRQFIPGQDEHLIPFGARLQNITAGFKKLANTLSKVKDPGIVKNVKSCDLCQGIVDRHPYTFQCRHCGAMGDLTTGIMVRLDREFYEEQKAAPKPKKIGCKSCEYTGFAAFNIPCACTDA